MVLTQREIDLRKNLLNNFEPYAKACLKLRSKSGGIIPFELNSAQKLIHAAAEAQLKETGRVRAIVCKGRQQGCSTYIQGRFYWRVTHGRGKRAFILTHDAEATSNLFDMTQRYHENCPPLFKPSTGAASANELFFDKLDSGYKVGTAGNKAVGRSSTIQLFHGSEAAYWPHAAEHSAGILQAVPDASGTEIWLESTSNGVGDFFHKTWQAAVAGDNGFIPIFVPWFLQDEYIKRVDDFTPTGEEKDLSLLYGLTAEQMAWRRMKIQELGGDDIGLARFKREYPCSPDEAFNESDDGKIIPINFIRAAVNRKINGVKIHRPIWGLDVAGESLTGDKTALAKRQCNTLLESVKTWRGKDPMQIVGLVKQEYDATPDDMKPSSICVDVIFQGAGIVARMLEIGLPAVGINVAESRAKIGKCRRLRDELWWLSREWFLSDEVVLPEYGCESLITQLASPRYSHDSSGFFIAESKDELKKRGISSPDEADAFNLTFADYGKPYEKKEQETSRYDNYVYSASSESWMG